MNKTFLKEVARVFVFAFVPVFIATLSGIGAAPNFDGVKALAVSAVVAGASAAVKAVVDLLTKGVTPVPAVGVLPESIKR